MKIGISAEYSITYIGPHLSEEINYKEEQNIFNFFIEWVIQNIEFNIKKGFDTTIIDITEFEFISDVFESQYLQDDNIRNKLEDFNYNIKEDHRIFFYLPRDFFLGSKESNVVARTYRSIIHLSKILNGFNIKGGIIIRVGSAYGDKRNTLERFYENFNELSEEYKNRIFVTNDLRPSLFSVKDLLTHLSIPYKIPIVFRTLGHYYNPGSLTYGDALKLSVSTWEKTKEIPLIIHSEPISIEQDIGKKCMGSANYLTSRIPTFNLRICVGIETQYKEYSCFRYINEYNSLKPIIIEKK